MFNCLLDDKINPIFYCFLLHTSISHFLIFSIKNLMQTMTISYFTSDLFYYDSISLCANRKAASLYTTASTNLIANRYGFHSSFFLFVKIKMNKISFLLMIIIQILRKLLFSTLVILISMPDFHLYDKLLP